MFLIHRIQALEEDLFTTAKERIAEISEDYSVKENRTGKDNEGNNAETTEDENG